MLSPEKSLFFLKEGDKYGSPYEERGLVGEKFNITKLPNKPEGKETDDSKMASIAFRYARSDFFDIKAIKEEYIKWAKDEGADDGIGYQTEAALLGNFVDDKGQGNGSLMRCIPYMLLLHKKGYSLSSIREMMTAEASITHPNKEVLRLNFTFFLIALRGDLQPLKFLPEEYKVKIKAGHSAWMYYTAFIVIEALKKNFKNHYQGFKYITSFGGDTDTNCAVYGAIRGARDVSFFS